MRKILITGGAGYIGSHAVRNFLRAGDQVLVVDNFSRGWQEPLTILRQEGNLSVKKLDLTEAAAIDAAVAEFQPEAVLHFAALCLVDESMHQPELYFTNNVVGTLNLLKAMAAHGIKNLIFSSTCAVYGEAEYLPIDERHPTNPLNPYGESKLIAEKMINWFGQVYQINYAILRYFNVCGAAADGVIGDSKKPSQLLMQNAVRGALGIEPFGYTCQKVATPDGTPIRDYIDVEDLVAAHAAAVNYLTSGGASTIFNLGNGQGYSVKEIVQAVEKHFGVSLPERQGAPRSGEYAQVYADPTKARELLQWQAVKSLTDSIDSLGKWYEKHPQGYGE